MNYRLHLAGLFIFGVLVLVQGEFSPQFVSLKNIPKGLTMIDVIESLTHSPKYLASSDQTKLKMLDNLISIVEELTEAKKT